MSPDDNSGNTPDTSAEGATFTLQFGDGDAVPVTPDQLRAFKMGKGISVPAITPQAEVARIVDGSHLGN